MLTNYLLILSFVLGKYFVVADITEAPGSTTGVCIGSHKDLIWKYSNASELFIAEWIKGGTETVFSKTGTSPGAPEPGYENKFEYISDGSIRLLNAVLSDSGTYKFSIIYIAASSLSPDEKETALSVLDPPDENPTGTCLQNECKCEINDLGTPAAQLSIKIDSLLMNTTTAHANPGQKVECCVVGANIECMPGKSEGDTENCIEVPGTTTTSTTTTTTSSMMTSSAIATTTTSLRTSTSISTSTTSTMAQSTVTSTKSTVKPSSRGTITRTSPVPVITTVPHVSNKDSDKALVTMIIVVSVIGGILIVAIFSILFVMMHWKSCFTTRGHSKQHAQKSDHRKQHRQAEDNSNGRFLTTRQDCAIRGYYFYNGTQKNLLFYDPFENSSYVNNYYPNQKNSHDPKYMSSHKTYQYNGDYNWDH